MSEPNTNMNRSRKRDEHTRVQASHTIKRAHATRGGGARVGNARPSMLYNEPTVGTTQHPRNHRRARVRVENNTGGMTSSANYYHAETNENWA